MPWIARSAVLAFRWGSRVSVRLVLLREGIITFGSKALRRFNSAVCLQSPHQIQHSAGQFGKEVQTNGSMSVESFMNFALWSRVALKAFWATARA